MERWVEHYSELYIVSEDAFNTVGCLPVLEELDSEPTLEELHDALDSLTTGKALGAIPAQVLKCCKDILAEELLHLLCLCWREAEVPEDRYDCNNYRGISLLSIVGKLFARVPLKRLQVLAERVCLNSQWAFRTNRSTIEMVFSLRQLPEKCRLPLFVAFMDLTKAFDTVRRNGFFKILLKILLNIIKSFHDDMTGSAVFDGSTSQSFKIQSGVKQGCVLAPTLFGIIFALLLRHAFGSATESIYLRTRSDGKLCHLSRLKAESKVQEKCLRDLLLAENAAITTDSPEELQLLMDRFSQACEAIGMTISRKKTQDIGQDTGSPPKIRLSDHAREVVQNFVYLGSSISDSLSLESELGRRIGKAWTHSMEAPRLV